MTRAHTTGWSQWSASASAAGGRDPHELLSCLLGKLSLVLELAWLCNELTKASGLVPEFSPLLDSISLLEDEVLECSNLVEIVLDILDYSRGPILHEIVHDMKCLGDTAPLLWFALKLFPQMLHDHLVVLPKDK